jgi:putative transcriptional regulator
MVPRIQFETFQIANFMCTMMIMPLRKLKDDAGNAATLGGQLLIAMPGMRDERFQKTVIYICAHSRDGAMGIVINQRSPSMTFRDLLVQLDVIGVDQAIRLPRHVSHAHILKGGPVETSRGFVLHSPDYAAGDATQTIANGICMTATLDILRAMARMEGPKSAIMALGYAGWGAGQLEREIAANGWLHCPGDQEIIFGSDFNAKYDRALQKLGVDPIMLSSQVGRA